MISNVKFCKGHTMQLTCDPRHQGINIHGIDLDFPQKAGPTTAKYRCVAGCCAEYSLSSKNKVRETNRFMCYIHQYLMYFLQFYIDGLLQQKYNSIVGVTCLFHATIYMMSAITMYSPSHSKYSIDIRLLKPPNKSAGNINTAKHSASTGEDKMTEH